MIKRLLKDSAKLGLALSATTTVAILAASTIENKGSWGAINSVSHIVDGDDVEYSDSFSPRDSMIGMGINAVAMFTWAGLFIIFFGRFRFPKSAAVAALFTGGAFVTDYYLVPKQYTPGIEKKVSKGAIFAIYSVMAATLAATPLLIKRRE